MDTIIRGYSGRQYVGDINYVNRRHEARPQLYTSPLLAPYLYHGTYGSQYGIFYLMLFAGGVESAYRRYLETSLSADTNSISIQLSEDMLLSELMVHDNYAHYFDVLPQSWLSYICSKVSHTIKFQLRFIPQSDLEEWLNTYWKYEPNK